MISLTRICREFTVGDERVAALRDVDLEIGSGEYVAVMGPSGSGKSTLLNMIGLLDRPDQLSGGQRQRVAIARAVIMQPHTLLADEPTGNLDRVSGGEVIDILEGLNSHGITLIMVTHDPELGKRAGRRIRMVDGRIDSDS